MYNVGMQVVEIVEYSVTEDYAQPAAGIGTHTRSKKYVRVFVRRLTHSSFLSAHLSRSV